jgi:hypothetical protein
MIRIFLILLLSCFLQEDVYIPICPLHRRDISKIQLTTIGKFGLLRKARTNVPAHFHTGIDIKRPGNNYELEPIFPIAKGLVISKRTDGPYANLIIEHEINEKKCWSLYEHIAGITVNINEKVDINKPIARFMNKAELNHFGWQFDHFHLEIIKIKPKQVKANQSNPERFYDSYSLTCYTIGDLQKYYFNPLEFLKNQIAE